VGRKTAAVVWVGAAFLALGSVRPAAQQGDAIGRGEYLVRAAGCVACHTDIKGGAPALAGGRALKTPFGTFYTPNITPDPEHGLGRWREADFQRALTKGRDPRGRPYYPAFPYTAYSGMNAQDIKDLWAYLSSLPPVPRPNKPHEIDFPFNLRVSALVWQRLFFDPADFSPDPGRDVLWNRGAYLTRHLGHCGECHSPRNRLGVVDGTRELAGNLLGPDGKKVPNITPHEKAIGDWSESDLKFFFKTGILPDGDFVGGAMEEVFSESTRHLNDEDRAAIAAYLKALPALPGPGLGAEARRSGG